MNQQAKKSKQWLVLGLLATVSLLMIAYLYSADKNTLSRFTENTVSHKVEQVPQLKDGSWQKDAVLYTDEELADRIYELNRENREHLQVFLEDGWVESEPLPYDEAVMNLDVSLLEERELELRQQLETTRVSEGQLTNAVEIALNAKEHRTRLAAIDAIGHRVLDQGGDQLITLFESLENESERSRALGYIRLESIYSPAGTWAIMQSHHSQNSDSIKQEIANKLLITGMMEYNGDEGFVPLWAVVRW